MDVDEETYLSLWKSGYFWGREELTPYFDASIDYAEEFDASLDPGPRRSFFDVEYDSIADLARADIYDPITNTATYQFYSSTLQTLPITCPFLDNRVVELSLRMPSKYKLRRNIVDDLLERQSPRLAEIKHTQTGQPFDRNATVQLLSHYAHGLYRLLGGREEQSGSWPDHVKNVREHGRIRSIIRENEACEFLDLSAVYDCYAQHMDGEDRVSELYSLVTFLSTPMTERVVMDDGSADR
ncbi:hypothetical protein [Halorubrum sp. Ea8]|uniref:hypothetical protein n=1 Tax=Halorubrum sp. Ea8 TaxID=1383841 RepID=UPI000B987232|nr:hypothetical protein [Halorubrum sp. Ea8]OYR44596.1 hypothetical protein DJ74_17535 [Halorubrum sp. Ea8]